MSSRIVATVFDCRDVEAQIRFWCAALGYEVVRRWRDAYDVEYVEVGADGAERLLFYPVPEHKQAKNRVHLDLRPAAAQYAAVAVPP